MSDPVTCNRLDDEMIEHLSKIRPLLGAHLSPETVQCSLSWLNKLSCCQPAERVLRNKYAAEILRQLQAGEISSPFDDLPKVGTLVPIIFRQQKRPDKVEDDGRSFMSDITEASEASGPLSSASGGRRRLPHYMPEHLLNEVLSQGAPSSTDGELDNLKPSEKMARQENQISKQNAMIEHYQRTLSVYPQASNLPRCDDREEKLCKLYEDKVTTMLNCIAAVRTRNEDFNDLLLKSDDPNLSWISRSLENEIWTLTKSIEDLEKIKVAQDKVTKDMLITQQREMTLKLTRGTEQLRESEQSIGQLEEQVRMLNQQLAQSKAREDENKMAADHEVMGLRGVVDEVRNSHAVEVGELRKKQQELATLLSAKEAEVVKLRALLKEACSNMQTDVEKIRRDIEDTNAKKEQRLNVKIDELKKTIQEQEEIKQKTLETFSVKLHKVLREKEVEITKLKIQLKTQKADLMLAMSAERQAEFEAIVSKLEDKYKHMVEYRDEVAMQHKERDMQRIRELEELLCKSAQVHPAQ